MDERLLRGRELLISGSTGGAVSYGPDGIVLSGDGEGGAWAWFGVEVSAAADLTELQEYGQLTELERYRKALEADRGWLASQVSTDGPALDQRWVWDPESSALRLVILGRVWASSPELAALAAADARSRMAVLPRHVQGAPIQEDAVLMRALQPFDIHPHGAAEIRKRVLVGQPQRPDARVAYYVAVQPWRSAAGSWEPLLRAIEAHPYPLVLSVCCEPLALHHGYPLMLESVSTEYTRLATPGALPSGIYSAGAQLSPDAFAVDAQRLFADAARRYRGTVVRTRIAIASPAPIDDGILALAGTTISPPEAGEQRSYLNEQLASSAFVVERPADAVQLSAFSSGLASAAVTTWGGHPIWEAPNGLAPPDGIRQLTQIADVPEVSAALRFPAAVNGHLPAFPVRRPGMAGASQWAPTGRHILLGRQLVGDRPAGPLGVELDDLTKHALFIGTVGSGKTNSTLSFLRQLWSEHRVPFLVIEPVNSDHDDYRWLATQPGFEDLVVLTVGDERTAPFRLNPFEAPFGVRIGEHAAALLQCFDAAFGLWDPLPHIYRRAVATAYKTKGLFTDDVSGPEHAGRWPTVVDLLAAMRVETSPERMHYAGEVQANILAASTLRAESLLEGSCASTLDCVDGFPMRELLGRPVVVELKSVGDNVKEQSLIVALLLTAMTGYYKANRAQASGLQHVTVIEEAHRLLGRPTPTGGDAKEGNAQARAAEAFANSLAENRKYGEGIVIVEQDPAKLVPDAYKNTNLKVMHRLPAEDDRKLIGGTMRFNADQERYAASLEPMTGFVYHDGLDRPALVTVPNVRREAAAAAGLPSAPLATSAELAERFRRFAVAVPAVNDALAPFAHCAGCEHRCSFRRRVEGLAEGLGREITTRLTAYPAVGPDRDRWWMSLDTLLSESCAVVPTTHPTGRRDASACLLGQVMHRVYGPDAAVDWVASYRSKAP